MFKRTQYMLMKVFSQEIYNELSARLMPESMEKLAQKLYLYTGLIAIVYLLVGFLLGWMFFG